MFSEIKTDWFDYFRSIVTTARKPSGMKVSVAVRSVKSRISLPITFASDGAIGWRNWLARASRRAVNATFNRLSVGREQISPSFRAE